MVRGGRSHINILVAQNFHPLKTLGPHGPSQIPGSDLGSLRPSFAKCLPKKLAYYNVDEVAVTSGLDAWTTKLAMA